MLFAFTIQTPSCLISRDAEKKEKKEKMKPRLLDLPRPPIATPTRNG